MTTYKHKNTKLDQFYGLENSSRFNDYILNYNTVYLAYNIDKITGDTLNDTHEEYLSKLDGWQLAYNSLISEETSAYNLRAVVFINKSKNALHFAFAGTDPSSYYDLLDDFYVYRNKTINKLNPMQLLVNKVDEAIGVEKIANYSISSSGHSLGAVLSDLMAAEMLSQGRKFTMSTTFDSPGSKPIIEEAIQNNLLTCSKEICLNDVAEHCKVFVVTPNFINSTNTQLSNDIRLVVPSNTEQSEYEHGQLGWTSFLYNMVGIACNTVADFLGINNVIRGVTEHKLYNFADYESGALKLRQWIEYNKETGYYNPTPIISEEENPVLALKLQDTQHSAKKDVLFECQENEYVKVTWKSYDELKKAQNMQSAKDSNGYSTGDENGWKHISECLDDWEHISEDLVKNHDDGYYSEDESDYQEHTVELSNQELAGQLPEVDISII